MHDEIDEIVVFEQKQLNDEDDDNDEPHFNHDVLDEVDEDDDEVINGHLTLLHLVVFNDNEMHDEDEDIILQVAMQDDEDDELEVPVYNEMHLETDEIEVVDFVQIYPELAYDMQDDEVLHETLGIEFEKIDDEVQIVLQHIIDDDEDDAEQVVCNDYLDINEL